MKNKLNLIFKTYLCIPKLALQNIRSKYNNIQLSSNEKFLLNHFKNLKLLHIMIE